MICLYTYVSLSVTLDIYDVWPYGYTKTNLQKLRIFNTKTLSHDSSPLRKQVK